MRTVRRLLVCVLMAFAAREAFSAAAPAAQQLGELFDGWYLNWGGLGLELINSYATEETVEVSRDGMAPGPAHAVSVHALRTVTGRFRLENSGEGIVPSVQAWDGKVGWQRQPDGGVGIVGNFAGDLWAIQGDLLFAYRAFKAPIKFTSRGIEKWDGRDCLVGDVKDFWGIRGTCWFDATSRRLVRLERHLGADIEQTVAEEYDDYRPVGLLHVPFKVTVRLRGSVTVIHRTKVQINPEMDDSAFILSTAEFQDGLQSAAIIRKHDQGVAGAGDFAKVHSRITHLTMAVTTTHTTSTETVWQREPNLITVEDETPGMGKESRGFDGKNGWYYSELQGARPLSPKELGNLMNLGRIHLVSGLEYALPFRRRVGERTIGGRQATALALANAQGVVGTFYFDQENARLLRIAAPQTGDRETSTESTTDFSDFRRVDGIEIPFVVTQKDPFFEAVSTVNSVENNPKIPESVFKPRDED